MENGQYKLVYAVHPPSAIKTSHFIFDCNCRIFGRFLAESCSCIAKLCYSHTMFIYFEIQHATIQQQNYKVHNTVYAYMDTKGRVSRHLHSTRKKENTYIWLIQCHYTVYYDEQWPGGGTKRVNRMDILSKGRNQFSLVYT